MNTRYVSFRLEGEPEKLMVFEALANGKKCKLALDTGAGAIVLSQKCLQTLGLDDPAQTVPGYGAGGAIELGMSNLANLRIGDQGYENLAIYVSDQIDEIAKHLSLKLDGVVGHPLLDNKTLEVNFSKSNFRISDFRIESGISFHVGTIHRLIVCEARIENLTVPVVLDTGASSTTISKNICQRLNLVTSPGPELTGAGGRIDSAKVPPLTFEIGSHSVRLDGVLVSSFLDTLSEAIDHQVDAVVGLDWLGQFNMKIDYENKLMVFRRY